MDTENFNFIEYTKASISIVIGDIIVNTRGTGYTVVDIDYGTLMVTISEHGDNYNITFDEVSSGDYRKVMGISNPYLD